ncbi:hypothetical protein vseg_018055 [Gypsophila vaccaria]
MPAPAPTSSTCSVSTTTGSSFFLSLILSRVARLATSFGRRAELPSPSSSFFGLGEERKSRANRDLRKLQSKHERQ